MLKVLGKVLCESLDAVVRCVWVAQVLGSFSRPQGALGSLHDKVVLLWGDADVVLVSPMPEPVCSSLQGPWCLAGVLCAL